MSDMTTDGPLTGTPTRAKSGPPMREYYVYFAVIFAATLPLALLTWTLSAARQMALPQKGPIAAAWSQANIITPRIFSA